ncbi:DUF2789 domain-containing protein [Moraxella osloensis]|jgi:hypothetical protein|uniref:DUF2789 domain-containing protein n=1 Tax=Faucicola osloensis TaxID=34062 RepID=A0AAD0AER2_FAUOS|nr:MULTISPECIES: DUF2789 family protein [Pseudomonadota]ATQ83819.1 DUF2789 domain-containing protein [Moraxella osloensis]ATW86312.1 DUF2789 domain-containing protein [Moraxella osloensis]ONG37508.1 hypothetical protein BKE17_11135 [Enhydrobacter sp. H5]VXB40890.1 conserved hypothetical protein [Enhydrobacter sp. AX1]
MMTDGERNINMLFEQMGMDGDDAAVEQFIQENQLAQSVQLSDAPFWSDNQRKFLKEEYHADAGWIEIIDELNTRLHKDAMDAANLTK